MITASIVIYNSSKKDIQAIITCIINYIEDTIYIIDNAFDDSFKEFIQNMSKKIVYIQGQGNIGYGSAHNIAIQKAITIGSQYHFIINPDIIIKGNIFSSMTEYMKKGENIGMMMPKILNLDGTLQYLPKLLPSPFMLLFRKIQKPKKLYDKCMNKYELRNNNDICNVPVISGCFSLLNLNVLQNLSPAGYDERFFMYFEDFDLSRRFHQRCKTLYYPLVSVYHGYERGAKKNIKLFMIFVFSAIKYFNKWGWFFDKERKKINKQVLTDLNMN